MIHFKKELYEKAIREIKNFFDIEKDFNDINNILNLPVSNLSCQMAVELDGKLRVKYSTINILLAFADRLSQLRNSIVSPIGCTKSISNNPPEYERLIQDAYGILADVLIKKSIIKQANEFIDYVD